MLFIGAGEMIELVRHAFRRAGAGAHRRRQPHPRARRAARRSASTRARSSCARSPSTCTSTTSSCRAPPRRCRSSARDWSSARCAQRRRRPMFMVDLAVPRDIEPEAGELDDVFLYTIDDLGEIVSANLDARRSALEQAEAIIDDAGRPLHALDAAARGRAADPRAARAGRRRAPRGARARAARRSRAARTRRAWSRRCRGP